MLNWIAIWVGEWLFGDGGPLQNSANASLPISNDVAASAKLPVFWGQQELQGLHIGLFIALGALVVFWVILNRTTLGYEVRAVGFNPDAAAYGGISVRKNLIRAMAISGAFAGLAGALDMVGYLYHYGQTDIPISSVGFLGIAVALLGRNTAVGVGLRRTPLRGPALRNDPRSFVERDPARAGRQPHLHHPGSDRALRRRRLPDPLRLERRRKLRMRARRRAEAPA